MSARVLLRMSAAEFFTKRMIGTRTWMVVTRVSAPRMEARVPRGFVLSLDSLVTVLMVRVTPNTRAMDPGCPRTAAMSVFVDLLVLFVQSKKIC